MKLLVLLLSLLLLTGCKQETPPVSPPVEDTAQIAEPANLYLYTNGSRHTAVDSNGHAVMEVTDGQMTILRQEGLPVGIAVQRSEGVVTDEYGWTQPEKTWCDIYDTTGTFQYALPVSYVNLMNGLVVGYNDQIAQTQVYRWEDGSLLYDNVFAHYVLGDYHYVNQEHWEAPGVFLDSQGTVAGQMPEGYTHGGSVLDAYMVVTQNGCSGVMAPDGRLLLACEYDEIRSGDRGCVYAKKGGLWLAIEVETGQVPFTWPQKIFALLPNAAIVATNENENLYQLIDLDGTPLMEQTFHWPSLHDFDDDGIPEVVEAGTNNYEATILFRPDGSLVYQTESNSYLMVLDSGTILLHEYSQDENYNITDQTWQLLNLETGEKTLLASGRDLYCSPLYTENGREPGLLSLSYSNELGWYRTSIIDYKGNMLLRDLQDAIYRGNGIFQCRLGFRSGLLTLDGTWLYEESSFSHWEDS